VADTLDDLNAINHFKIFLGTIYALFSQSTKNLRELSVVSAEIGSQLLKIGRIFDVRWVSSSHRTVCAVWRSFQALSTYFLKSSEAPSKDGNERQKFKGLAKRLCSPQFVCNLGLLHDVFQELSNLSLQLQKRSMTIPYAESMISRTVRVLQLFKDLPG
jgi:hypothetical protein